MKAAVGLSRRGTVVVLEGGAQVMVLVLLLLLLLVASGALVCGNSMSSSNGTKELTVGGPGDLVKRRMASYRLGSLISTSRAYSQLADHSTCLFRRCGPTFAVVCPDALCRITRLRNVGLSKGSQCRGTAVECPGHCHSFLSMKKVGCSLAAV